jgi:NAD(P)-dependent dehydrogenase (short-subunit alcohol dehydrogenase family)
MSEQDGGSIINIGASGSLRPQPDWLPYAMAKAALNALTQGLVGAFGPKVRVNTILPGPFATDIAKAWTPEIVEHISARNPLGRPGRPEDAAALCVYLASDAASYVNGAQIVLDGGLLTTL